jgi:D-lactate dehydrogenase (cytochrome)
LQRRPRDATLRFTAAARSGSIALASAVNGRLHAGGRTVAARRDEQAVVDWWRRQRKGATMALATARQREAAVAEGAIQDLQAWLGDRLMTNRAICAQHGRGEGPYDGAAPQAVAIAHTTEEVGRIVSCCAAARLPVVAFGAGTSLEGHVEALEGGICIDLSEMNRVLDVSVEDLDCLVEAGVRRRQLNEELRHSGLFFPVDPGADASLGGMAATRASGTNAVRYGTMREVVLGLTAVLADGRIVRTGGRARKSAAGYDLTRLLIGSEGTLGIITELRLRLFGIPEAISAATATFPTVEAAVETVMLTIQSGIPIARIELLDEVQMRACIAYSKLAHLAAAPTLFFEFHGSNAGVREQAQAVEAIAREHGGTDFRWSANNEERNRLWRARHDAYYAALALKPGCRGWATDVCVPISRLAECVVETQRDVAECGLLAPLVGHVGDGNFHLLFLLDPDDADELARAKAANARLIDRALAMGGTCTGEHGVGFGKLVSLEREHGAGVEVMRTIKRALDPHNILNPGKVVRLDG